MVSKGVLLHILGAVLSTKTADLACPVLEACFGPKWRPPWVRISRPQD